MNKSELFWQTYLNLENELLELSKYIYITDERLEYDCNKNLVAKPCYTQLETFSPYIADLLVRTCVEIEAISKELYFELEGPKQRGSTDIFFDGDCLGLLNDKCNSEVKKVIISCLSFNLTDSKYKIITPLKNAHRSKAPWERAYQDVKHDRYSSVSKGTVWNFVSSLGALYLLNIYYKNQKVNVRHSELTKLDFSFGSKIFSLMKPSDKYINDVINGISISENLVSDESPYILKFADSEYHEILKEFKNETERRNEFIYSQPEIKDQEFLNVISKGGIFIPELFKYRINKNIPKSLSFEERKKLFVSSRDFRGRIRLGNAHLEESEITEDNIQNEIDNAGYKAGLEIEMQFQNPVIQRGIINGYCELLIDKGNVKYN